MCSTSQNVLPISKMFELAREKKLEEIGLRPLPQKDVWDFSEESFPDQPFFLRGEEANRIFSWNEELMQHWKNGAVDIDEFVRSENGFNKVETFGSQRPETVAELLASRTVSFELPRDKISFQPYPNVDVMSTGCIAAQGHWFTASHIEWGGGESIAKLISGKKLWVIATTSKGAKELHSLATFSAACRLLNVPSVRKSKLRKGANLEEKLMYHLGEPGDVIIQPAFATHFVVTEATVTDEGELLWACVTGFEGLDNRMLDRAARLFDDFITGFNRALIRKELQHHGVAYCLRLLKIRDYRSAMLAYDPASGVPLAQSAHERDVTTHLRVLFRNGYDVLASLSAKKDRSNWHVSGKKRRTENLPHSSKPFKSTLSEVTLSELQQWPTEWVADIDQSHPRRT